MSYISEQQIQTTFKLEKTEKESSSFRPSKQLVLSTIAILLLIGWVATSLLNNSLFLKETSVSSAILITVIILRLKSHTGK